MIKVASFRAVIFTRWTTLQRLDLNKSTYAIQTQFSKRASSQETYEIAASRRGAQTDGCAPDKYSHEMRASASNPWTKSVHEVGPGFQSVFLDHTGVLARFSEGPHKNDFQYDLTAKRVPEEGWLIIFRSPSMWSRKRISFSLGGIPPGGAFQHAPLDHSTHNDIYHYSASIHYTVS